MVSAHKTSYSLPQMRQLPVLYVLASACKVSSLLSHSPCQQRGLLGERLSSRKELSSFFSIECCKDNTGNSLAHDFKRRNGVIATLT